MTASSDADRRRSYQWGDTKSAAAAARGMSGRDYLTALMKGEVAGAPMAATLDFSLTEVDDGRVVFACTPSEFHYNPIGSVHGGLAGTLIDSATGCAVHTKLPAGTGYATINFSVDLIRAITDESGALQCEGRVVRFGGRIAVADADVKGPDGTLYARGSATCLILRPEKG